MPEIKVASNAPSYVVWSPDENELETNYVHWAAKLVVPGVVTFGPGEMTELVKQGKAFEFPSASIVSIAWQKRKRLVKKVPLDALGPDFKGMNDDIESVFDGALILIRGEGLRMRTRALCGHYGDSFDDYPKGQMRLWIDGLLTKISHDRIMDKIHELKRINAK